MDSWFREDLLSSDCYFALKFATRPLFPAQEWTPGPLSQPWKARLMSAGMFEDHQTSVDPSIEHAVMKTIVTDLRELFMADEYLQTHVVPADDQLLRWRQLRKYDCMNRLADHCVNLTIYPHLFKHPETQSFACTAAALLANMILGSPEPVRFGVKLTNDLWRQLVEAEGHQAEYPRLRLWALYVGSLAEKVHPVSTGDEGWFASQYDIEAATSGMSEWHDAKSLMKLFLFSDTLHAEIESGRSHRILDVRQGLYAASGCSWREPFTETSFVEDTSEETAAGGKQRPL
jgi:hypothetical protein